MSVALAHSLASVMLGYLRLYPSKLVNAWASGTGFAGVGGSALYLLYSSTNLSLQFVKYCRDVDGITSLQNFVPRHVTLVDAVLLRLFCYFKTRYRCRQNCSDKHGRNNELA